METRRLSVRSGRRSHAGYGWRTASRLISKRISPEPGCPPSSREWFQVKPRFSGVRVLPAVKTARWPPRGPAALPRQGDRPADTADDQPSGQEPQTALPVGATGARTPSRRIGRGVRRRDVVTPGSRPVGPCLVLVVRPTPSMRPPAVRQKPLGRPFALTDGRPPWGYRGDGEGVGAEGACLPAQPIAGTPRARLGRGRRGAGRAVAHGGVVWP